MGKIYLFNMISADGYFAGPNNELDWHNVDEQFQQFAIEQLGETGLIIFGRITYELMYSFWPTDEAKKADPETAEAMNNLPKVVFSRTMEKADYNNTRLFHDVDANTINKLKSETDKKLAVLGSSNLAISLMTLNLIDELRLMVNPVILGKGKPLLAGADRVKLNFIDSRDFKNGNVLLRYSLK